MHTTHNFLKIYEIQSLIKSTGWAKKVAQSSNHHIDAIVSDKIKQISPKCP